MFKFSRISFSSKLFLLFITAVIFAFGAGETQAATSSPAISVPSTTIVIGDQINIKVSNNGAVNESNDIPVSFVGIKEGVAKVTACRQATNCASINISVIKKAAKKAAPAKVVRPAKKKVAVVKKSVQPTRTITKIVYVQSAPVNRTETQGLILSQNNITVQKQDSVDIYVQDTDAVTAMSDSLAISASVTSNPSLHNVKITVYGVTPGTANLKICDQRLVCGFAQVTVVPTVQVAVAPVYVPVTSYVPPVTPVVPVSQTPVLKERYVTVQPGESAWITTNNSNAVSVVSDIWLVGAKVRDNFIYITVNSFYYGEAHLNICSLQNPSDCELVHVNSKSKPTPISV